MVRAVRQAGVAASLGAMLLLGACFQSHPVEGGNCEELCVSDTITWGYVGGLAFYTDESQITACRTFQHTREEYGTGTTLTCTDTVPACAMNPSVSVEELEAMLADPDVVAAVAAAPVLYGLDTRPVDGQVLRIAIGDAVLEVGSPCLDAPSCEPIPEGVQALGDLLSALTMLEISQDPCLSVLLGE